MLTHARARAAAIAVAATAVALPATAAATIVIPPSHTVDLGTATGIGPFTGGSLATCDVHRGTVAIPTNPISSGAVSLAFTRLPTFTCREFGVVVPNMITTSGSWTLELTWGAPTTARIVLPRGGIRATNGMCPATNTNASIGGAWQNGATTPRRFSSIADFDAVQLTWTGGCGSGHLQLDTGALAVTDVTDPTQVPLVGP